MNFSKSVYVVISIHGTISLDRYFSEPDLITFTVPTGVNIIDIMASPPGAINMVCYDSIKVLHNVISNTIVHLDAATKEHLDDIEVLVPVISNIQQQLKEQDIDLLKAYKQLSHSKAAINDDTQEMHNTWDNRFKMGVFTEGDELLDKTYMYDRSDIDAHWLDNKIQVFNMPEQDEGFDLLGHLFGSEAKQVRERYFIIDTSDIITFLQAHGVENIVLVDLSCSSFEERENLSHRTARGVRREYHKETQKFRTHPYSRIQTKKLGGRQHRRFTLRRTKLQRSKLRRNKLQRSKLQRSKLRRNKLQRSKLHKNHTNTRRKRQTRRKPKA